MAAKWYMLQAMTIFEMGSTMIQRAVHLVGMHATSDDIPSEDYQEMRRAADAIALASTVIKRHTHSVAGETIRQEIEAKIAAGAVHSRVDIDGVRVNIRGPGGLLVQCGDSDKWVSTRGDWVNRHGDVATFTNPIEAYQAAEKAIEMERAAKMARDVASRSPEGEAQGDR